MSDLNERLAMRADELAITLDENAKLEGDVYVLTDGAQIFTKGIRRGFAMMGEERMPILALVGRVFELGPVEAVAWCEDWLGFETVESNAGDSVTEPAAGTGGFMVAPHDVAPEPSGDDYHEPKSARDLTEPTPEEMRAAEAHPTVSPHVSPHESENVGQRNEERRMVPANGAGPARWKPEETHRLLPQSADAEKGVICSFLLAPVEVGGFCRKKGVEPGWFHIPHHAEIFAALMGLWLAGKPIDFIILTNLLRDEGRLEQCGGASGVTELFTFLPTAANLAYYVEILDEKKTLRAVIATCTSTAARCYDEQGNVPILLGELEESIERIAAHRGQKASEELLGERAFDVERPPAEPRAIFTLAGHVLATAENLMMVAAKVKAGKTAALGAMIASTMEPTRDCLGFTSANPLGHALIHFDTEQSKFHHHMVIARALYRAGRTVPPPWLHSYYIKGVGVAALMGLLRDELERRARECGGIFAVILDGIGDFCLDVNDPEMSFALVAELERLAVKYQCVFVLVLHENPGSDIGKTRGHLGSHLERKAETNLRLEKDADGVTVIYTERSRACHIPKDKGVRFEWDEEARMHLTTDAPFKGGSTASASKKCDSRKNDRLASAKDKLGKNFVLVSIRRADAATKSKIPATSFDNYWGDLKRAGLILADKTIPGLWVASPEWERELALDFPEAGS